MTATLVTIALAIPALAILWFVGKRLLQALFLLLEALDARWGK